MSGYVDVDVYLTVRMPRMGETSPLAVAVSLALEGFINDDVEVTRIRADVNAEPTP